MLFGTIIQKKNFKYFRIKIKANKPKGKRRNSVLWIFLYETYFFFFLDPKYRTIYIAIWNF